MPTYDAKEWEQKEIEKGNLPDKDGFYHYTLTDDYPVEEKENPLWLLENT